MGLLLASWCLCFVGVVVYLIFEPLGLDFELPSWPSDLQKHVCLAKTFDIFWKVIVFEPMMVLLAFWGPLGFMFGGLGDVLEALWVLLGGFLGAPGGSPATLIIILGPS